MVRPAKHQSTMQWMDEIKKEYRLKIILECKLRYIDRICKTADILQMGSRI